MHWVIFYFFIVWHRPQPSRKVKDKQAPHIKEKVLSGVKTQKELKAEEQRKLVQEKRLKKDRTKGSIVVASYNLWDGEWLVSLEFVAKKIFVIYAQINVYVVTKSTYPFYLRLQVGASVNVPWHFLSTTAPYQNNIISILALRMMASCMKAFFYALLCFLCYCLTFCVH